MELNGLAEGNGDQEGLRVDGEGGDAQVADLVALVGRRGRCPLAEEATLDLTGAAAAVSALSVPVVALVVGREELPVSTELLALSCVGDGVALLSAGAAVVRTSEVGGSAEGAGGAIHVVGSEGGAGGAHALISEALETVGVRAGLTESEE